ncbi:MAG TPA: hypothetical protein VFT04_00540 [Gemmatimonadales bacterium]|nr:hypothetical protein [Gemmatimonadales bacterium]
MHRPVTPLDAATPLLAVLDLARPGEVLGVWIDIPSPPRPMALRVPASPRWISLLLSSDLASLLARARRIVVARGGSPCVRTAEALTAGRRLEVETPAGIEHHPLDGVAPEAVLTERRSFRRILASRVGYLDPG